VQAPRLAARLRALREAAGMSQERLAFEAKVSVSTLRKIETGAVIEPGYFTVLALIGALGMSLDEFSAQPDATRPVQPRMQAPLDATPHVVDVAVRE
jgi:transcriptional regulator with XRE-family HTH domain